MTPKALDTADAVSQTLLIPLWARAMEQCEPAPLVADPVATAMRRNLLPPTERNRYLAYSAFDPAWMNLLRDVDDRPMLAESFSYFDDPEPRMGFPSWLGRVPALAQASRIARYRLGIPAGTA